MSLPSAVAASARAASGSDESDDDAGDAETPPMKAHTASRYVPTLRPTMVTSTNVDA
jgi:hypothetical protein